MSNMVEKLEHDKPSETILNARCNLAWFRSNILPSWIEEQAADTNGPTVVKIHRRIAKKVEIWHRVSFSKGDSVFELKATYPEGYDGQVLC